MQNNNAKSCRTLSRAFCAALVLAMAAAASASAASILTLLHSFAGGASDGANPFAGLLADTSGNLYGTTQFGGASGLVGTVFKLTPSGTLTLLHSFDGSPSDRAFPVAGLLADSRGNLFGTTQIGGASIGGVVFKLPPSGTLTLLHSFSGGASDGALPVADLLADTSGNLFGTTFEGGASNGGVVFKLTPSGTLTLLHSFAGGDGAFPVAGLIADSRGNLFGTTEVGGASNYDVVFKLTGTGFQVRICGGLRCT